MKPAEDHGAQPMAYLQAELQWLDLLLHREILRLRARYQLSFDEFRGLYISDEHVDALVNQGQTAPGQSSTTPDIIQRLTTQAEQWRGACRQGRAAGHPLSRITQEYALSAAEQDILVLALAPELDIKYETLFAYLNDDIQRKQVTVDLALRVLAQDGESMQWRSLLQPEATLFASGLLHHLMINERQSSLHAILSPDPQLVQVLLGWAPASGAGYRIESPGPVAADDLWRDLPCTASLRQRLQQWAEHVRQRCLLDAMAELPAAALVGQAGNGMLEAVAALAATWQRPVVHLDLRMPLSPGESYGSRIHACRFAQRLCGAVLHIAGLEAFIDQEQKLHPDAATLDAALQQAGHLPLLVETASLAQWQHVFPHKRCLLFEFADPDYSQRVHLWRRALDNAFASKRPPHLSDTVVDTVADRFHLTAQQIRTAAQTLADRQALDADDGRLEMADVLAAAREQSHQPIERLAQRVTSHYEWQDLILPHGTKQRLQEIAAAIRHRQLVLGQWGFGKHQSNGGLKAMFSGPSGTGKTMAASIIARELGLELFRIDLSQLVSKYIGETEKNLDKAFRAAQQANAILFFDEADALFGKRTEIKDAHDRYANIEVAYLLQKMEDADFSGVVLMATNLVRNIDDAFARRIHYLVEFPMPDAESRVRLWRAMFPAQAPLAADVDMDFLAQQFDLTGGVIRNVALEAAFLAAGAPGEIRMRHIVQALSRQMIKQGRIPVASDFKQHLALIDFS